MTSVRDILNYIKWHGDRDIKKVRILYLHRGAPDDIKEISGNEIVTIGKSFFETKTATIPYHRVIKVFYENRVLFDRFNH